MPFDGRRKSSAGDAADVKVYAIVPSIASAQLPTLPRSRDEWLRASAMVRDAHQPYVAAVLHREI